MFIKSIKINRDILLDNNRESQKKFFKIKKKTYTEQNLRKPIIDPLKPHGRTKYEMKKVIEKTFVIHKANYQLDFKEDITIIVGDNGCGKTHLLSFLEPKFLKSFFFDEDSKKEAVKEWLSNEKYTLTFCNQPEHFIHGNQIHKNSFIGNLSKSKLTLSAMELTQLFDMNESSNGENVLDFVQALSVLKNSLIILDEPETSLSIKSQVLIKKTLVGLAKNGNQLIIITHSPILMELSNEVYDFEHLEYVNTKRYITEQIGN